MGEQNEREAYNEAAREDYEGREREEMDRPLFTQREVDADIAAAVRAEREAILSKLVDELNRHRTDDGGCTERFCGRYSCSDLSRFVEMIRARDPSPTIPAVGEWTMERSGLWRFIVGGKCLASLSTNVNKWFTFSPSGGQGEGGYVYELEAAKRQSVAALVRQGWYRETTPTVGPKAFYVEPRADGSLNVVEDSPTADVLEIVREWAAAREEHRKAHTLETPVFDDARREKVLAANDRLEAATARLLALVAPRTAEESSGVQQMMGFRVIPDVSVPPGEIHLKSDGCTVGKMVNMDAPAKGGESSGVDHKGES